jgi:hypothetical protein
MSSRTAGASANFFAALANRQRNLQCAVLGGRLAAVDEREHVERSDARRQRRQGDVTRFDARHGSSRPPVVRRSPATPQRDQIGVTPGSEGTTWRPAGRTGR